MSIGLEKITILAEEFDEAIKVIKLKHILERVREKAIIKAKEQHSNLDTWEQWVSINIDKCKIAVCLLYDSTMDDFGTMDVFLSYEDVLSIKDVGREDHGDIETSIDRNTKYEFSEMAKLKRISILEEDIDHAMETVELKNILKRVRAKAIIKAKEQYSYDTNKVEVKVIIDKDEIEVSQEIFFKIDNEYWGKHSTFLSYEDVLSVKDTQENGDKGQKSTQASINENIKQQEFIHAVSDCTRGYVKK